MTGQLDLIADNGEIRPEAYAGAELAADNADAVWRSCAEQALAHLAKTGQEFTAEDLRDLGVPEPDHANRWGAVFLAASRRGEIVPMGARRATRGSRNASLLRVWRGAAA